MKAALSDFDGLLDWNQLNAWFDSQSLPGSGRATQVERLSGGSQNNLFLITRGSERFVLRRPPLHPRANSNETMLREARVLKALTGSAVPHPHLHALCDDTSVIGACFYVMAPLEGFSPINELRGNYATNRLWREAMGEELVRAAVALAAVDHRAVGLGDLGKPENWHSRQVDRWRSQLDAYRTLPNYEGPALPHVETVSRWLSEHIPQDGRIGIIHGDLQFPNAMFSLENPRITGIIDWELCSLGDPLLDLGWVLSSWTGQGDPEGKKPMVTPWDGFVSRAQLVSLYADLSGRDVSNLPWFFALACFKLGCILEGTYARARAGLAPMTTGERLHVYAVWLLKKAKQIADLDGDPAVLN
jgi:aminoglycoside phosphotransferase (APT) family kinase protein